MNTLKGVVKWFNDEKGFGFIKPDEGGSDCFAHFSDVVATGRERRTLAEGAQVEFEAEDGERGRRAKNIVVVG